MASLVHGLVGLRTGLAAYALCVVACGDSGGTPSDGRAPDSPVDVRSDAPPACDVTKPFGPPSPVAGINTAENDKWGWQTADQRTIYFSRAPTSTADLYVATRAQPQGAFSGVTPLTTVNTGSSEARPIVSSDGRTLYMEYVDSFGIAIHYAVRSDPSGEFSAQMVLPGIDTTAAEFNPWITDDGLTLYFTSDRDGFNDMFVSTRAAKTDDFADVVPVTELNSAAGDYMGALSSDGLELFFGSSRDTNLANDDIFHATRSSTTAAFGAPSKIAELSDAATDEYPTWLSADRCQLMFTSNRGGGSGGYDVWLASRPQ